MEGKPEGQERMQEETRVWQASGAVRNEHCGAVSRQSLPVDGWFPWTMVARVPLPLPSVHIAATFRGNPLWSGSFDLDIM